jgi:hypothetical protein
MRIPLRTQFIVTALLMAMLVTQTACPKKGELASYARDVVSALNDTVPILENAGLDAAKLRQAVDIGNRLVSAFESNQSADAISLTSALVTAFEGIVSDTGAIKDPRTRTLVLVALATGNVALHYIANHLPDNATASGPLKGSSDARNVLQFKKKPRWRCRSSQTGRFEDMGYCKAHPDVSQVETF